MLDETAPDLLDIITTPESHAELVTLGSERGIPTICQKPLAPMLDEAECLVETAERTGTLLVVHENWRFMPWNREIGRLIADHAIGTPYNITFRMRPGDGRGPRAHLDRQPYFQKMPRFLIHETGIHTIDVFRFLMGEVDGVFAKLRKLNPVIAGEDAGLVTFSFASGAAGLLDGNRLADFPAENARLTMGTLLLEGSEGPSASTARGGSSGARPDAPTRSSIATAGRTAATAETRFTPCRRMCSSICGRGRRWRTPAATICAICMSRRPSIVRTPKAMDRPGPMRTAKWPEGGTMRFRNVVVTGGSGQLGRFVVNRLGDAGYAVKVIDLQPPHREGVSYSGTSITDLDGQREDLRGCDAIVHLAAVPNPRTSSPQECLATNTQGTWTTLQAAEDAG